MRDTDKAVRQAVARYRGMIGLNLMKSLTMVLVGVLAIYLLATDKVFDSNSQSAPLYKALGPDVVKLILLAFGVAAILFGLYWTFSLIRAMRQGAQIYEAEVRKSIESSR